MNKPANAPDARAALADPAIPGHAPLTAAKDTLEPGSAHAAQRSQPGWTAAPTAGMTTAFGRPGRDWTVVLRRQPARIVAGQAEGGYTDVFEIICCDCGDDPDLDYRDVPPVLQRIRGAYPIAAGVAAYEQHLTQHPNRADQRDDPAGKRPASPGTPWPRPPMETLPPAHPSPSLGLGASARPGHAAKPFSAEVRNGSAQDR